MPLPVLSAEEQRVLGCLLEKQRTVPASYPLSLNALRLACNQSNSRDPIVDYDERTVSDTVRALKDLHLVRLVWAGAGSRTVKYHQLLEEHLGLTGEQLAVMTVLLLRGPQSPGELKTRTERLHPFADRAAVEACLAAMAAAEPPLVRELPLLRGRDPRWIHLLGPVATLTETTAPGPDREIVLAGGAAARAEVGRFEQLLRPRDAAAWGAVVAWYSFVHLAPSELAPIMRTIAATLRPGGTFALALHLGEGVVHADDLFGTAVDVDFVTHDRDEVLAAVSEAGLEVAEWFVRSPVPSEAPNLRLYVLAQAPA